MEKRLKFICWKCEREYSLLKKIEGKPKLFVACPFCGEEAVVDLSPWDSTIGVHKSHKNDGFSVDIQMLPDVLPTQPKE